MLLGSDNSLVRISTPLTDKSAFVWLFDRTWTGEDFIPLGLR